MRVVLPGAPDFPGRALDLETPPERLFVAGVWPAAIPLVAIVGARAATPYGLARAERLAGDLARLGIPVVSGLAHGIDAAAHRGALEAGGATIAVLPCGHDRITPRGHEALVEEIARQGAVVSEYAAGAAAYPSTFLERNRLIAAFAHAVVVVEARERSGALNTANHARRLARPVLAVPGDVDRPTSRGCHALIRAGASICEDVKDVLRAIGFDSPGPGPLRGSAGSASAHLAPPPAASAATTAGTPATRLLAALDAPRTLDACAAVAGLPIAETQAALLELEWAGLARAEPGGRWVRTR